MFLLKTCNMTVIHFPNLQVYISQYYLYLVNSMGLRCTHQISASLLLNFLHFTAESVLCLCIHIYFTAVIYKCKNSAGYKVLLIFPIVLNCIIWKKLKGTWKWINTSYDANHDCFTTCLVLFLKLWGFPFFSSFTWNA